MAVNTDKGSLDGSPIIYFCKKKKKEKMSNKTGSLYICNTGSYNILVGIS